MKKISIMLAALVAVAFTACDEAKDDNPVLGFHEGAPEVNFLNQPVMADQYIEINDGDKGTLLLTCSQPTEYGYAASAHYEVLVSMNEDFTPAIEGGIAEMAVGSFKKCDEITPKLADIAEAVCKMLDVKNVDALPAGYYPLYMRLKSSIYTDGGLLIPNTEYLSNVVEFKHVRVNYLAVIVPGQPSGLYLRGGFSGEDWDAIDQYQFLTTSEKGVYMLTDIDLPEGTKFKVADAKWGTVNCGSNGNDCVPGEEYELNWDGNSSDITLAEDFTGYAILTFADNKYTLLLVPSETGKPAEEGEQQD